MSAGWMPENRGRTGDKARWVLVRWIDGRTELMEHKDGTVRRFASRTQAEKFAERLDERRQ